MPSPKETCFVLFVVFRFFRLFFPIRVAFYYYCAEKGVRRSHVSPRANCLGKLAPRGHEGESWTQRTIRAGTAQKESGRRRPSFVLFYKKKSANSTIDTEARNPRESSLDCLQVSVLDWYELPQLLDRLQKESDDYIDKLQVTHAMPTSTSSR